MSFSRVQNTFISDGTAIPASNVAITDTALDNNVGIYGLDGTALGTSDTTTEHPVINIFQKDVNGKYKKSMNLPGKGVVQYTGQSYASAQREVWTIGYNRKTAAGSVVVADDTLYEFSIVITSDKQNYQARPLRISFPFTSSASATQSNITAQIVSAINSSAFNTELVAMKVGDGTGLGGVTGATNFGVEVMAKIKTQFSTSYIEDRVRFSVAVDDSTGFSTTVCAQLVASDPGSGTYQEVYNLENFDFGYEGVVNRTKFPIPTLVYQASNDFYLSSALTSDADSTSGEDVITATATGLKAGDKIQIDSSNEDAEIKFITDAGKIVTIAAVGTHSSDNIALYMQYDMYTVEFNVTTTTDGTNTPSTSTQSVIIAVPAIDAGDAYTDQSVAGASIEDVLNSYMGSSPLAFAALAL